MKDNEHAGIPCPLDLDELEGVLAEFHAATDRSQVAPSVLDSFLKLTAGATDQLDVYLRACERKSRMVSQAITQAERLEARVVQLQRR